MNWPTPVVVFAGTLGARGGGPARGPDLESAAFIRSIAGWDRLAPETLTLENVVPSPESALASVSPLGTAPSGARGAPNYHGGVAFAGPVARPVIVRQPPDPTLGHGLEVMADVGLRRFLAARCGDLLHVTILEPGDWRRRPVAGYHRMCG